MKKMRILSLLTVVVLLFASLGLCVTATTPEEDHQQNEEQQKSKLTATAESTVLIADDDPVAVKLSEGKIVSAVSSDDKVATFDLKTNKIVPVGEGNATITFTNNAGKTASIDVKVYGSALSLGFETALLGMGIVFSVLIIIWIILAIFGKIATVGTKEKKAKPAPAPKAPAAPVAAPVAPAAASAPAASDDAELVAAITAAVSLCMDMPVGSFRVVSFRKTNTKQAWNKK